MTNASSQRILLVAESPLPTSELLPELTRELARSVHATMDSYSVTVRLD